MSFNSTELEKLYRDTLLNDVVPFWEKHSLDKEYGGYFSCLDRRGNVYDTDKFSWPQGRQIWIFSMLYRCLEKRQNWLDIAKLGIDFLKKFGRDESGNWYFSYTRQGRPLVQPYNWFSDAFAAQAFASYALACGDEESADIARQTFRNMIAKLDNPKGIYNKLVPDARPMKSLAFSMIMMSVPLELQGVVDDGLIWEHVDQAIDNLLNLHYDDELGIIRENVAPDGSPIDCYEGRVINIGHGIECLWFVMDAAQRKNDTQLINQAIDIMINQLNYGWDKDHGGILYFQDVKGYPPEQLMWDQKLWWVHNETLVALAMACNLTGRDDCIQWYQKVHDYTWSKFPDPEYGEWFGYLHREGHPCLTLKGSKWKCCYHIPRFLYLCYRQFQQINER